MHMKRIRFLQILIFSICLISCELIIPAPKMFSCKVNGKLWEPIQKSPLGGRFTGSAYYYPNQSYFSVYGSSDEYYIAMTISLDSSKNLELNKKYLMELVLKPNYSNGRFGKKSSTNSSQNIIVNAISGYIVITKMDTQYFSGSFEFDLEKEIESKTYKIRKGQFNDMLYVKKDN